MIPIHDVATIVIVTFAIGFALGAYTVIVYAQVLP